MDIQNELNSSSPYFGRIVGSIIGLVIAILIFTIGFWYTAILTFFIGSGFILGMWSDGVFSPSQVLSYFRNLTGKDEL